MKFLTDVWRAILINIELGDWHIVFFQALMLIGLSPIAIGSVLAIVYIPLHYIQRFLKKRFSIDLYKIKYISWFEEDFEYFMDEYPIFGIGFFSAGVFWVYWLIAEPLVSLYRLFF